MKAQQKRSYVILIPDHRHDLNRNDRKTTYKQWKRSESLYVGLSRMVKVSCTMPDEPKIPTSGGRNCVGEQALRLLSDIIAKRATG